MSKVIFVDTSATAKSGKRRGKPHVCYDGGKIFETYELTKLKNYGTVILKGLEKRIISGR
jgi:hypothetical protein